MLITIITSVFRSNQAAQINIDSQVYYIELTTTSSILSAVIVLNKLLSEVISKWVIYPSKIQSAILLSLNHY